MTVADWDIDLDSPEARQLVEAIATEGVPVFRAQPGFVRYRLMLAAALRTVRAVVPAIANGCKRLEFASTSRWSPRAGRSSWLATT